MQLLIIFFVFATEIFANTENAFVENAGNTLTPVTVTAQPLAVTQSAKNLNAVGEAVTKSAENLNAVGESVTKTVNFAPEKIDFEASIINAIKIKWDKKGEQIYYNIYRKGEKDNFVRINQNLIYTTEYVDTDINTGDIYFYAIQANDSAGNKYFSKEYQVKLVIENSGNTLSSLTITAQPLAVTVSTENLNAGQAVSVTVNFVPEKVDFDILTINAIKIKWDKKGEQIYYDIYRKGEKEDFVKINQSPIYMTKYVDTDINTGTIYFYAIQANDSAGNKYLSKEFQIKSADIFLPSKPVNFKVYQDVECSVLKWEKAIKGTFDVAGYNIYRGESYDSLTKIANVKADVLKYEDVEIIPAKKYYYMVTAYDAAGNESPGTDILNCIPFPMPRTSLILMPTAYRNDIFNNWGLNIDFNFSYYIGGIFGEHDLYPYGKDSDSFLKVGAWLLTGDIKLSGFNDIGSFPSIAVGYIYTILMQDKFGSSNVTGMQASFSGKEKESMQTIKGFYAAMSKKVFFDIGLHGGYIFGEQINFIPYLSKYLDTEENNVSQGYYLGFNRTIISRMGFKLELIVPVGNKVNPTFFMPGQYLINTHIDRFINFDFGYFHFNGGYIWLGYINFRFTIFPNPYKP